MFAAEIMRKRVDQMRAWCHWRWHFDEIYVNIHGETHYLWPVVDHNDEVLESFVTKTRDRRGALKFLMQSMRRHGGSVRSVTDLQRSYGTALKDLGRGNDREMGRWMNNRATHSHLAFRRRERAMLRFRRIGSLQEFATVHASVCNHSNQERTLTSYDCYKANCAAVLAEVARSPLCLTQTMVGANGSGVHISLTAPPDPFACKDLWLRLAA